MPASAPRNVMYEERRYGEGQYTAKARPGNSSEIVVKGEEGWGAGATPGTDVVLGRMQQPREKVGVEGWAPRPTWYCHI